MLPQPTIEFIEHNWFHPLAWIPMLMFFYGAIRGDNSVLVRIDKKICPDFHDTRFIACFFFTALTILIVDVLLMLGEL